MGVSESDNKYRTFLRDNQSNEKLRVGSCFQFLRWLFCVYNLSLLVSENQSVSQSFSQSVSQSVSQCDLQ